MPKESPRYSLYQQRARYNRNTHPPVIVATTRRYNGILNVLTEHIREEGQHLRGKLDPNARGYVSEGPYRKYFYVFSMSEDGRTYYRTYFYIRDRRGRFVEIV